MKSLLIISLIIGFIACNNRSQTAITDIAITSPGEQEQLFQSLVNITNDSILAIGQKDSLAFLILPLEASCPACRKKAIDSIIKYKTAIPSNHFIILSLKGSRKMVNSFFREENAELPEFHRSVFLDTTDEAGQYKLYDAKPTMYYAINKRVFRKVASVPLTIKKDLQYFFSSN